jgi:ATP synthase protein I
MTDADRPRSSDERRFIKQVSAKETRKLDAQRREQSVWFGLGMMGLVGWSVAIPTLIGVALGTWLDRHYPSSHSWALTLLLAGLIVGCLNAWHWVVRENMAMRETPRERDGR